MEGKDIFHDEESAKKRVRVFRRLMCSRGARRSLYRSSRCRLDANQAHHSVVLMFEKVAMVGKCADGFGIAEIHSEADAWILQSSAVEVRDVYGVAKKRFVHSYAGPGEQQKMQLMNMECVELLRAVFDDPVFHVALLHDDVGYAGCWVESDRRLAVHGDEEGGCAVRIVWVVQLF